MLALIGTYKTCKKQMHNTYSFQENKNTTVDAVKIKNIRRIL